MAGAGRKLVVVLGFIVATMAVSGVAGAEPEREGGSGSEARATVGEAGSRATSVAGDQYAGGDGGSGGGDQTGEEEENRPEPDPGSQDRERQDGSGVDESRGEGDDEAQQSVSQNNDSRQSVQRQSARQQATQQRETGRDVSREAKSPSGARAQAETRRVRSPEIRSRVRELRQEQKAGNLRPAATGQNKERRQRELRIARKRIVTEPVDEASLRRYKELYEEAAEEYGFGEDWYVLAAVGKVESDHGQNMGPSSAGALGPMQFMPSTWASYGLDANDDGKANIMDPEDAIPSAARYLKVGGAPDDWYRALYTYNHAGWYVEKVLRVAERYRLAAGDEEVGPYYPGEDR